MHDSPIERILSQLTLSGECWEWNGSKDTGGYGRISVLGEQQSVHRLMYEHFIGIIPVRYTVDHLCRNHACCNPRHLQAVPHKVNVLRGIGPSAINSRKTHCKHGHKFTPENTYTWRNGNRTCRICSNNLKKTYREKNREKIATHSRKVYADSEIQRRRVITSPENFK